MLAVEPADVLAYVNAQHGTEWHLVGKLAGGHQLGAYEIRSENAHRAILKWHRWQIKAESYEAAARIVREARVTGWPTPRWLAYGLLPGGEPYLVADFINGASATTMDETVLNAFLSLNRSQAGRNPDTDRDWSAYMRNVLWEEESGQVARLEARSETAAFVGRLRAMTDHLRDVRLPSEDLVHGDFTIENVLFDGPRAFVIDVEWLGKGTRAYDLATLLLDVSTDESLASIATRRRSDLQVRTSPDPTSSCCAWRCG